MNLPFFDWTMSAHCNLFMSIDIEKKDREFKFDRILNGDLQKMKDKAQSI